MNFWASFCSTWNCLSPWSGLRLELSEELQFLLILSVSGGPNKLLKAFSMCNALKLSILNLKQPYNCINQVFWENNTLNLRISPIKKC